MLLHPLKHLYRESLPSFGFCELLPLAYPFDDFFYGIFPSTCLGKCGNFLRLYSCSVSLTLYFNFIPAEHAHSLKSQTESYKACDIKKPKQQAENPSFGKNK